MDIQQKISCKHPKIDPCKQMHTQVDRLPIGKRFFKRSEQVQIINNHQSDLLFTRHYVIALSMTVEIHRSPTMLKKIFIRKQYVLHFGTAMTVLPQHNNWEAT